MSTITTAQLAQARALNAPQVGRLGLGVPAMADDPVERTPGMEAVYAAERERAHPEEVPGGLTPAGYRQLLRAVHSDACDLSHRVHLAMDELDTGCAEWDELHRITKALSLAADLAYEAGDLGGITRPTGLRQP